MNVSDMEKQWNKVLNILAAKLGKTTIDSWLKPLTILGQTSTEVMLEAPTKFIKNWVEKNYDAQIKQSWKQINPAIEKISYVASHNASSIFENDKNLNSLNRNTVKEKELSHSVFSRRLEL